MLKRPFSYLLAFMFGCSWSSAQGKIHYDGFEGLRPATSVVAITGLPPSPDVLIQSHIDTRPSTFGALEVTILRAEPIVAFRSQPATVVGATWFNGTDLHFSPQRTVEAIILANPLLPALSIARAQSLLSELKKDNPEAFDQLAAVLWTSSDPDTFDEQTLDSISNLWVESLVALTRSSRGAPASSTLRKSSSVLIGNPVLLGYEEVSGGYRLASAINADVLYTQDILGAATVPNAAAIPPTSASTTAGVLAGQWAPDTLYEIVANDFAGTVVGTLGVPQEFHRVSASALRNNARAYRATSGKSGGQFNENQARFILAHNLSKAVADPLFETLSQFANLPNICMNALRVSVAQTTSQVASTVLLSSNEAALVLISGLLQVLGSSLEVPECSAQTGMKKLVASVSMKIAERFGVSLIPLMGQILTSSDNYELGVSWSNAFARLMSMAANLEVEDLFAIQAPGNCSSNAVIDASFVANCFSDPGMRLNISQYIGSAPASITSLFLTAFPVADPEGIQWLPNIEYLVVLNVQNAAPIGLLTNLRDLSMYVANDFSFVAQLQNLRRLRVESALSSNVAPLSALSALEDLWIPSAHIENVAPLSGLTNLRRLHLAGNRISNISPFESMSGLLELNIDNNSNGENFSISCTDRARLQASLPTTAITGSQCYCSCVCGIRDNVNWENACANVCRQCN